MSINTVVLTGRLTRDADLRTTNTGKSVAAFTLAVDRSYGQDREADFVSCVAWNRTAEVLTQYTHKGSKVAVEGRLQTRSYDNQQGQKVHVTEVIVNRLELLDSKQDSQQVVPATPNVADPFADTANAVEVSDDDLPF